MIDMHCGKFVASCAPPPKVCDHGDKHSETSPVVVQKCAEARITISMPDQILLVCEERDIAYKTKVEQP